MPCARCLVPEMQCMFHISRKQIKYKIHHANCMNHPENIFSHFNRILSADCQNCLYCHDMQHQAFKSISRFSPNQIDKTVSTYQPNTAILIQVVEILIIKFASTLAVYFMNGRCLCYTYLSCFERERERDSSLYGSRNSKLIDSHQF